jgi:hypothetical protein
MNMIPFYEEFGYWRRMDIFQFWKRGLNRIGWDFVIGQRISNRTEMYSNSHLFYCFSQNLGIFGSANISLSGSLSPVKIIIRITPPLLPSRLIANANAVILISV